MGSAQCIAKSCWPCVRIGAHWPHDTGLESHPLGPRHLERGNLLGPYAKGAEPCYQPRRACRYLPVCMPHREGETACVVYARSV